MDNETNPTGTGDADAVVRPLSLKIFGVGGAGGNAVDYMARQDFTGIEFTAVNTDVQALGQLRLPGRLTLGAKATRGLGTGGDPERGRQAAEEDVAKLRALCAGADMVCIVAGMGGGTGTGAGPVLARLARETGALVLGIVTLPFDFEGARRQRQAQRGLNDLKAAADGVICLPNQKVFKLIDENTSVPEALKITNELLTQGVRGIWRLLTQAGMINVDFNDLCAVLRDRHEESSLATIESSGENRAGELIEKLATHPFLEDGQALADADAILVSLAGGPEMTMAEVNRIMEKINQQAENAHIIMGAGIQESLAGKISVTIVASRPGANSEPFMRGVTPAAAASIEASDKEMVNPSPVSRPASRFTPVAPDLTPEQAERLMNAQRMGGGRGGRKPVTMSQGQLRLEIVTKGRFEQSEPTVLNGEDLDVPAYIRRGVALN